MSRKSPRNPTALALLLTVSLPVQADLWSEPSPWRGEALLEGRDFEYNTEAFLHRLSYRHLEGRPLGGEDGARGTAGSVRGDELFVDIAFQKHLYFDDDRHFVFVRLQRFEDFDGRFDRQLVGFGRRLGSNWRLALAGDVQGDKSEIDLQVEATWQPDDHQILRLVYMRPEHFYNDKGSDGRYRRKPQSLFAHYRHDSPAGVRAEVALNYSLRATLDSESLGVEASGRQWRLMAQGSLPAGEARLGARLEMEHSDRDFDWLSAPGPGSDSFQRRMTAVEASIMFPQRRWSPQLGARYLRFEEDGWFGTAQHTTGEIDRREPLAFGSLTFDTGERHHLSPTVYVSRVDNYRRHDRNPARNKDEQEWVGKLALPWRYTVDQRSGAVLTINPTVHLHRGAFGGGNMQLHWPL